MNNQLDKPTALEIERRVHAFATILPGNPATSEQWDTTEISRVMLKHAPMRFFNPAVEWDKHDIQHELRRQYYKDIELEARAKIAQLKRDSELRALAAR